MYNLIDQPKERLIQTIRNHRSMSLKRKADAQPDSDKSSDIAKLQYRIKTHHVLNVLRILDPELVNQEDNWITHDRPLLPLFQILENKKLRMTVDGFFTLTMSFDKSDTLCVGLYPCDKFEYSDSDDEDHDDYDEIVWHPTLKREGLRKIWAVLLTVMGFSQDQHDLVLSLDDAIRGDERILLTVDMK